MADMNMGYAVKDAVRHQRVDGHAHVRFNHDGLADLYQRAPSRLLFPTVAKGAFPEAVSILTAGGMTGGDKAELSIHVGENAELTVTTQAAERFYRALDDDADARFETRITVETDGRCEWLAQEAILFNGARLRRRMQADLAPNGRLLALECTVLGRSAMGEIFERGLFHDGWRIRRDGRLIWADALHLRAPFDAGAPFGMAGCTSLATLIYAGQDAAQHLELARSLAPAPFSGATLFDGLLLLRYTARDAAGLRRSVMAAAGALRSAVYGLSPTLPAVWHC